MGDVKNNEEIIILKGDVENAVYKEQELDEYKSNPFIEALPNIFNEEDVISRFTLFPHIDDKDRHKSTNIRYHIIRRAKNFIQPLPTHIVLERRLSILIRRGYLARNPTDKTFLERLRILNKLRVEVSSGHINDTVINERKIGRAHV